MSNLILGTIIIICIFLIFTLLDVSGKDFTIIMIIIGIILVFYNTRK